MFNRENNPNIIKALATLKILLYLSFIASTGLFYHTHITQDGTVITHSHFFKSETSSDGSDQSNSGAGHSHSNLEYKLLDLVSSMIGFVVILLAFGRMFGKYTRRVLSAVNIIASELLRLLPSRAPPALS